MKYYIIAGEASGDLHAGSLMRGIYHEDSAAVIRFHGGAIMEKALRECSAHKSPDEGMSWNYRNGAVMGFSDVVLKLGKFLDRLDRCMEDILEFHPDVLILVDYPGFNLRIAKWAHEMGFKVYYYIAPKVWASREFRIKQLRRYVDRLYIIFPFEKEYFDKMGLPYVYLGNPLVEEVDAEPEMQKSEFCKKNGLPQNKSLVAMLAGSRKGEVKTMMPILRGAADILSADERFRDCYFVIAGAPGRDKEDYGKFDASHMGLVFGQTRQLLKLSDAAVINSGTASLEAVLTKTPQVVLYKFASVITTFLAWLVVRVKYISLGNLCLDKLVFKEYYRPSNTTPEAVANEVARLLTDKEARSEMLADYKKIRECLGGKGASQRIAADMVGSLKNHS